MLLYTSRDAGGSSHFRIRGLLPLHGMLVSAWRWAGLAHSRSSRSPHPAVAAVLGASMAAPHHAHQHPQDQAWSSSIPPANPKESCPLAGKPMESLGRALGPQRGWRDGADTASKGES